MPCPECHKHLILTNIEGYLLYACPSHHGFLVSFDAFYGMAQSISLRDTTKEPNYYFDRKVKRVTEHRIVCPICMNKMIDFNYAYSSNVILSKCNNDQIFWVDEGEIYKVAEHIKGNSLARGVGKALIQDYEERNSTETLTTPNSGYVISWQPLLIGDTARRQKLPISTTLLIILTIGVAIFSIFWIDWGNEREVLSFLSNIGLVPTHITINSLITSQFFHLGLFHLVGNMLFLWIFGDNIEDIVGHYIFIPLYLALGIIAGVGDALFRVGSDIAAVGASGSISGIMGMYIIFHPKAKLKILWLNSIFRISAIYYLSFWFVLQVISSIVSPDSVAWGAHIVGFVAGVTIAIIYKQLFPQRAIL